MKRHFTFKVFAIAAVAVCGAIGLAGCGWVHHPYGWYGPGPEWNQEWREGPEPGYMDYGMGPRHMMDYNHPGRLMHGSGWGRHQGPGCWRLMTPEQQEKCKKMQAAFLAETLELRKELVERQIELETLWAQPNMDRAKVEKLSTELAEIQVQLRKKWDQHLLMCREEFGDQNWACPGAGW
jgi:hypothetical protein